MDILKDDLDSSLEAALERAFSSASCEHLRLDDDIFGPGGLTCAKESKGPFKN